MKAKQFKAMIYFNDEFKLVVYDLVFNLTEGRDCDFLYAFNWCYVKSNKSVIKSIDMCSNLKSRINYSIDG